jgi:hypothetical protein
MIPIVVVILSITTKTRPIPSTLGHSRGSWVSKTVINTAIMNTLNFVSLKRRGIFLLKLTRLNSRSHELPRGQSQSHQYLPLKRAIPIPATMHRGMKYPRIG